MKTGSTATIQDLAAVVEAQKASALDLMAATPSLTMLNARELHVEGHGDFQVADLAHKQIADERNIPRPFYERLRSQHPDLLDRTVNELWRREPARHLIRVHGDKARAYLGPRYRRLDNADLLEAVIPVLAKVPDLQIPSCEVTETRLYLKAVSPRVQGEVKPGDIVQAGVMISNSEVGVGALRVQPLVYRLVCTNGMVAGAPVRRFHVGRQIDSDEAVSIFQDETLRADDRAYWLKVRDVVEAAVSEARFQELLAQMRLSATTEPIADVGHGVEVLAQRFSLSGDEQSSVLHHLATGGDLTRWGALNAVTRASQDVESYQRATELEEIGGSILAMTGPEWAAVAAGRGAAS